MILLARRRCREAARSHSSDHFSSDNQGRPLEPHKGSVPLVNQKEERKNAGACPPGRRRRYTPCKNFASDSLSSHCVTARPLSRSPHTRRREHKKPKRGTDHKSTEKTGRKRSVHRRRSQDGRHSESNYFPLVASVNTVYTARKRQRIGCGEEWLPNNNNQQTNGQQQTEDPLFFYTSRKGTKGSWKTRRRAVAALSVKRRMRHCAERGPCLSLDVGRVDGGWPDESLRCHVSPIGPPPAWQVVSPEMLLV